MSIMVPSLIFSRNGLREKTLDVKKIDKEEITERFDTLVFGKEKETLKHSLASCYVIRYRETLYLVI